MMRKDAGKMPNQIYLHIDKATEKQQIFENDFSIGIN